MLVIPPLPQAKHMLPFVLGVLCCGLLACGEHNPREAQIDEGTWLEKGDSITRVTFDTLRNTLMRAIAARGVEGAIGFCNAEALSLTSAFASKDILVRRTALRYRNPSNAPDSTEIIQLSAYAQTLPATGKPVLLKDDEDNIHYFKPIYTLALCLNCHGDPGTHISPATQQAIRRYYPDDKATGFGENSLRGMWHVVFQSSVTKKSRL